jgi:hypothetical protein
MKNSMFQVKMVAVVGLVCCACCLHALAQGNLVINGGFETLISGKPFGWALTNGNMVFSGNPSWAVSLDNSTPSATAIPMVSQTVTGLVSGLSYTVSGQYQQGKDRL